MKNTILTVKENDSKQVHLANLIVSVRRIVVDSTTIVVGHPGLPNAIEQVKTGDAILYETPNDGVVEIRALSVHPTQVQFLVSQVSPRLGIMGGFIDDDPNNTPFSALELNEIKESIKRIQDDFNQIPDITTEQFKLLERKLIEIEDASTRLGRKDWINYVAGTLTTLCASAAFAPDTTKSLFKTFNVAFRWLFENALVLIGGNSWNISLHYSMEPLEKDSRSAIL